MNDLFVSIWGEDWVSYLAALVLLALISTIIRTVSRRWRPWRRLWMSLTHSEKYLKSAQNLLHLAKRRDYR